MPKSRWNLASMLSYIKSNGATPEEGKALEAIFNRGNIVGHSEFQNATNPSFVVYIPTAAEQVQLLTATGRKVRFYFGHFIGGYDDTKKPNYKSKKFPHAYELAAKYARLLNDEFGWSLTVKNGKGGFSEPEKPLADVSPPTAIDRLLAILDDVSADALRPPKPSK